MTGHSIKRVEAADSDEVLPLMRAYCDFYEVSPTDAELLGVVGALLDEPARGRGVAERLIEACRAECARRDASRLTWQTAPDNLRAQAVYQRAGARREQWIDYWLPC